MRVGWRVGREYTYGGIAQTAHRNLYVHGNLLHVTTTDTHTKIKCIYDKYNTEEWKKGTVTEL